jgi:hypothetical protein
MEPAGIQSLPAELLDEILSYLFEEQWTYGSLPSLSDLLSISYTSQRLRLHALRFIYRGIQFTFRASASKMKLLLRTLLSQPGLLEHIRTACFELDVDMPRSESQPFTQHDIELLASFMRGIGIEPTAFIWRYSESLGRLGSEETVNAVAQSNWESGPMWAALIFARLLTCSSSKPLALRLVSKGEALRGSGEFWEILNHLIESEWAGGLRRVRQLSYDGYKAHFPLSVQQTFWGAPFADRPVQQRYYSRQNELALLFEIPMESISLSTNCRDSLAHVIHPGVESALISMTLRGCEIAPLASILQKCSHLTTLNYIGLIHDFIPFDMEALGIALGHSRSLEHVNISFEFARKVCLVGPWDTPWLLGNIGTLKGLAQLKTLEIPTQVLLGLDLDTPRRPLWDVFPAGLLELQLRDDGSELSKPISDYCWDYCWDKTLSPLYEYLDWRENNCGPSMGVALDWIGIVQRNHLLDSAVVEELQLKCDHLGITFEL